MTGRAILHVTAGPQAFQKAVLYHKVPLVIGQSADAHFQLHDKHAGLSEVELILDEQLCTVRLRNSDASFLLNGQSVKQGQLAHHEWFRLGETTFLFCLERHTQPRALPSPHQASWVTSVLSALRSAQQNLYAVLDAARDERILELLRESADETRSLYEGIKGDTLAEVAPYLVKLDPQGFLLEALICEGWGQNWGIYLDCPLSFSEVRRHFRRILWVQAEGKPNPLYFRFYDPRVLRIFALTCTKEQLQELYGPLRQCWVEDFNHELLSLPIPLT